MSKNNRGKGLKNLPNHGRGTCPVCKKTGIKVIFEAKIEENTVKVCKVCGKNIANQA
jgi:transcription elongation factor Elf1